MVGMCMSLSVYNLKQFYLLVQNKYEMDFRGMRS